MQDQLCAGPSSICLHSVETAPLPPPLVHLQFVRPVKPALMEQQASHKAPTLSQRWTSPSVVDLTGYFVRHTIVLLLVLVG